MHVYNQFRDQGQVGVTITALSGIDVALWDAKGRRYGVPVSSLLGGAFRRTIPAYATGAFRRPKGDRPAYLAEEASGYIREGFGAVKIKIGFDVAEDIAAIRAVREAIGGAGLMIDANHGYDAIEALEVARGVEDCDDRLVRGAGRSRGAWRICAAAPVAADPDCGRRNLVHALGISCGAVRRCGGHRPARRLRRRRVHRGEEDRRHGVGLRRSPCSACLGHGRRAGRRPAISRRASRHAAPARAAPALARIRPHAEPVPPGGADQADRACAAVSSPFRKGRGSASRSTATRSPASPPSPCNSRHSR